MEDALEKYFKTCGNNCCTHVTYIPSIFSISTFSSSSPILLASFSIVASFFAENMNDQIMQIYQFSPLLTCKSPLLQLLLEVVCSKFINVVWFISENFSGETLESLLETIRESEADEERPGLRGGTHPHPVQVRRLSLLLVEYELSAL